MLEALAKRILGIVCNRSLPPPSKEEKALLSELTRAVSQLPVLETRDVSPSEVAWQRNANRLRELVLNQDPRKFLRWDVVANTMFIAFARYIRLELAYLKRRPDWDSRWRGAIREASAGCPTPYLFYPTSSGNLIHHAYHVAQFEEKTGLRVQDIDTVLEFGGGYGSMCRLLYNLGFRGRYIIVDVPAFSALQIYFLKTLGLPVQSPGMYANAKPGIFCVANIGELGASLMKQFERNNAMFIATWSMSEVPLSVRYSVLPFMAACRSFLISYQDEFREVNNDVFFSDWRETRRDVAWQNWPIEHLPGSRYLVGRVAG